jgi:hypothetical protein
MLRYLALGLALFAAACGTTGGGGTGGTITGPGSIFAPEPKTAWENLPQGREWTAAARAAIDASPALLATTPKDIAAFCPSYAVASAADKRDFWVVLISDVADLESGLNTAAVKTAPGAGDVRRGLLAISTDAASRYGCAASSAAELLDPAVNITCGSRILAQTSGVDGYVTGYDSGWRGAARYWLELRKPEQLAELQSRLNAQNFCARRPS